MRRNDLLASASTTPIGRCRGCLLPGSLPCHPRPDIRFSRNQKPRAHDTHTCSRMARCALHARATSSPDAAPSPPHPAGGVGSVPHHAPRQRHLLGCGTPWQCRRCWGQRDTPPREADGTVFSWKRMSNTRVRQRSPRCPPGPLRWVT